MTSPTTSKALVYPANGADIDTWDSPLNLNWNAIDAAFGGVTSINAAGASGVVTLTSTQYIPPILVISGALTSAVNYQLPSGVGGLWIVSNETSGAYSITISSAGGGNSLVVGQGVTTPIACDGANVFLQSKNIPVPPGGASGDIQWNNGGALAGDSGLITDGSSVAITGNMTVGAGLTVDGNVLAGLNIAANAQTPEVAVAFSATAMAVNLSLGNVFLTTLAGNVTTAPAMDNAHDGQTFNWFIVQDGTGSRTMTWPVAFKWPGGVAGVLSTAAGSVDLLVATYLAASGNFYCSIIKAFA